jgi:hypothetical protein
MSLEAAIKEAYASAPTSKVIFHTLEIRQDGVQDAVYIVQSARSVVARDELGVVRTFEPVGFQFSLPPANEEGFRDLNIAIDNVGQRLTDYIAKAKGSDVPVKIFYRPYLSDDLTKPQMNPPLVLWLRDVQVTTAQVVGRATFMDIVNAKFPLELYTRDRFPALE